MSTPVLISYVGLWLLVALQSLVIIGLLRVVYRLQSVLAAHGLPDGNAAPEFTATALDGEVVSPTLLRGARAILCGVHGRSSCLSRPHAKSAAACLKICRRLRTRPLVV